MEGTSAVGFFATDNSGNVEARLEIVVKRDTIAPQITPPPAQTVNQTGPDGAVVTFAAPTIMENGSGLLSSECLPVSGSVFPVGPTVVMCTALDVAGNTGTASFTITVVPVVVPEPDGRMYGLAHIDQGGQHHHFAFRVSQVGQREYGRFEYWVNRPERCPTSDDQYRPDRNGARDDDYGRDHRGPRSHFEATSITSVVFSDNPAFGPGRASRPPAADTVTFGGTGTWNRRSGYTFEAVATDRGEPGRTRDTFQLVVKDARGIAVDSVEGVLDGGNIQSLRLRDRLASTR
jgi:hypothetical protein